MFHRFVVSALAVVITLGCIEENANSDLVFQNLGGNQAQVDFDPIVFSATATHAQDIAVVFEDFFTSNYEGSFGSAVSGTFQVSINSAPAVSLMHTQTSGQISSTFGIVDPNDLLVQIEDFAFSAGDTLQIEGVSLVYTANPILTPSSASSFEATLSDSFGAALSNTVVVNAVPEPSLLAICGIGVAMLAWKRRRS